MRHDSKTSESAKGLAPQFLASLSRVRLRLAAGEVVLASLLTGLALTVLVVTIVGR